VQSNISIGGRRAPVPPLGYALEIFTIPKVAFMKKGNELEQVL